MVSNAQGSVWHRWDPHIHAPGTILADNFAGSTAWDDFLTKIETATPVITALGVTDYLSFDLYERVRAEKAQGRLASVELIFPNIEMRFGIATAKNDPINFHLLVSPEHENHITELQRFLRTLTFHYDGLDYACEATELMRLGRAYKRTTIPDHVALREGTNQFKVDHEGLRKSLQASPWAQKNVLIAVAGSSRDGTAGLQEDTSFSALRENLERAADIIFSGSPKQRNFWLGKGAATPEQLKEKWGGLKPCLHGSDAHDIESVANPSEGRFCWLRGQPSFDSLRQACFEPESRTFIGVAPPRGALPSQTITKIVITDAPWLKNPEIPLNPGLVTVIGARGSGKTALADLISAGGYGLSNHLNEKSFIRRAAPLLGNPSVKLIWDDGRETENSIQGVAIEEFVDEPRVQYLSQQFVDKLCSSEGLADALVGEIERVVFQAHDPNDRMGATTFSELLDIRTETLRRARQDSELLIATTSEALMIEQARKDGLTDLRNQRSVKASSLENDQRDRQTLVANGQQDRVKELELVTAALTAVRSNVDAWSRGHRDLLLLKEDVVAMRKTGAPNNLRSQRQKFIEADLSDDQWKAFLLNYVGDVDEILDQAIANAAAQVLAWRGPNKGEAEPLAGAVPAEKSLIPNGAELAKQTSTLLSKEENRLRSLIGIDEEKTRQYSRLSAKISREELILSKLDRDIKLAEDSEARIKDLQADRSAAYQNVFQAIVQQEAELSELYAPLGELFHAEAGVIGRLGFSVCRHVDIGTWSEAGEEVLDLRTGGPFRGKGSILKAARELNLDRIWGSGTAAEVATAVGAFRSKYSAGLLEHCSVDTADRGAYFEWIAAVSKWLFSTTHITVSYGVQYEGVDIEQLSPGTRGIVLLLLYLAIDQEDDRPLIIDQPEENLDPRSVFEELVGRFKSASKRRQIIVVTHNANLVVNTDADQVIIATAAPHRPGQLPDITYVSGGLEEESIREEVCNILEGGKEAFKERARRLRVRL